jgi:hypothetical protein
MVVLGFELRAPCLLGRCSTACAVPVYSVKKLWVFVYVQSHAPLTILNLNVFIVPNRNSISDKQSPCVPSPGYSQPTFCLWIHLSGCVQ